MSEDHWFYAGPYVPSGVVYDAGRWQCRNMMEEVRREAETICRDGDGQLDSDAGVLDAARRIGVLCRARCGSPHFQMDRWAMAGNRTLAKAAAGGFAFEWRTIMMTNACPWCGMIHQATCSRVKAMEYYPDGSLKRVELHEPQSVYSSTIDVKLLPDAPSYTRGTTDYIPPPRY